MNVSFDAGAGAVKVWTRWSTIVKDEKGQDQVVWRSNGVQVLSQVAVDGRAKVAAMPGLRKAKLPSRIEFDAGSFYVGAGAHDWGRAVENLDYDRLTGTPEMRALFYAAMTAGITQYLASGVGMLGDGKFFPLKTHPPVSVTVGLPIEAMDAETVKAVKGWMLGEHAWLHDDREATLIVEDVKCTSQPVGALFDYLMDDEGKFISERKRAFRGEVGILSIGHSTVELLGVRNRAPVQKWTKGEAIGVQRLLDIVRGDMPYSRGELDERLRAGKLDIGKALPVWWSEVSGHLDHEWGRDWKRFEAVIVVGGGAILLRDQLARKFGVKAFMPDDPVLSIARGLWKLGEPTEKSVECRE